MQTNICWGKPAVKKSSSYPIHILPLTHTPIFVSASFSEGSVSASLWAIWESDWCCLHMRDPSLCMFRECVWRRQWRRKPCLQACLYLICSCMQKVMCQTAMKVRPLRVTSLAQDAFVSLKPNTSARVTRRAGCNWDVSGRGHTELVWVSVSPLLARYLIRDTPSLPLYLPPPPSSSSSLCLSVRHTTMISYTVCTFDQLSWVMVFRLFKVAWICARAENGKQTWTRHPSVPI